jgi:putative MATE family efflux protein
VPSKYATAVKDILPITLPILAEQAIIVSMGVVNAAMASNIGKEAASAIGMVDAITWVIVGFFTALALGGTVLVAQSWGRGDRAAAERAAAQAAMASVVLAAAVGVLTAALARPIIRLLYPEAAAAVSEAAAAYLRVTALGYPFLGFALASSGALRGAGDTRTPMRVNVSMGAANVGASALLIFGLDLGVFRVPSLGVEGAAAGITIARAFGAALYALFLARPACVLRIKSLAAFRPDGSALRGIFAIGLPSGVENLAFNGGKLLAQTYIVSLGTDSIAANFIGMSVASFIQIPSTSLGIATTTLVGQAVGRGDEAAARRSIFAATGLSSLALLAVSVLGVPLERTLIGLYTRDPGVSAITATLLGWLFVALPLFWSTSFIIPAGFRGAGDVRYSMVVSMASMWILRVSLGYVLALPLGLGVLGVWIGMFVDWIARSALFGLRLRSGAWLPKKASRRPLPLIGSRR